MKNKKTKLAIIGIIALILVTIGLTYAYWLVTKTQTNENVISSACLDIAISGEKNDIELTNQYPLSDEEGMKLTPYEFTVKNYCNTSIDYQIALEATSKEMNVMSSSALKVALDDSVEFLDNKEQITPMISGAYEARKLTVGTLDAQGTATYKLRIWIDENAPISESNKSFKSKITVTVGQGITKEETTKVLKNEILADANNKGYLKTETPDFSKVTSDGEFGLYSAEDDYGTSYYFRGDVENNYVKLGTWKESIKVYVPSTMTSLSYKTLEECVAEAENGAPWSADDCQEEIIARASDGMHWRIVRINGDGTIRLVYDGTNATANGVERTSVIARTGYNSNYDNAKYVGYTYEDGSGNEVDSTIKGIIDTWYQKNLANDYGKYLADSIFCNDREVTSTATYNRYYGAYDRLETNKNPKLSCTQKEDRYTVSDTTNGNGLLSNPVGLITADEFAMAGGVVREENKSFYLYDNYLGNWTMSPESVYLSGDRAYNWWMSSYLGNDYVNVDFGVRPVINLKEDVVVTGTGTVDDPYVLVTE